MAEAAQTAVKIFKAASDLLSEDWRDIPNYPQYQVSDLGRVVNKNTDKELKHITDGNGFVRVTLYKNGVGRSCYVHRAVAEAFIEGYDPRFEVEFRDLDKTNCAVSNLRPTNYSAKRKADDKHA